ncbi:MULTISPECIES: Rrf2 family transcriptional regulator [Pantoea]|uniref:Rrf2 family transcriptional regulator n=1 Tax=Candidatus Pantoea gossypiicola TaxID=2608008 RepID=A0AB34CNQ3_9GAMM|nr:MULTISPECIES: Rrf2 family transcriptional regulator [Pantoea]KAA5961022.1 Rrf2 family transcriptional regulator [Pantoea sp. VH_24]KAA5964437.1 Rrf2 family transcriptional regulator [Pantoea sp. VH_16]KAA5968625.1 Rrf2 family transcriptional regulator [Pantoea sp. VH_18]KAA6004308.1 Rrf2 family transcriptional regulator [Pantoea sp. M_1]KAA6006792.1 Rrf2 family transcriptional regulator [Pantoea sp. F_7]
MKIEISENDNVIWMRDTANKLGIASKGYLKDGTQQKIIAALEDALAQAKGEALSWNNVNTVFDVG